MTLEREGRHPPNNGSGETRPTKATIGKEEVASRRWKETNGAKEEDLGPEIIIDDPTEREQEKQEPVVSETRPRNGSPTSNRYSPATGELTGKDLETAARGYSGSHEQYLLDRIIEQENTLAKEARQLYCSMTTNSKLNLVTLAQTNGLLAASILMPGRTCAKMTGMGEVILLQQCKVETVTLTYRKTRCGYEPVLLNTDNPPLTISRDGMSTYPFLECFWPTGIININGKAHELKNGTWVPRKPTLHFKHLKLVGKFPEIEDKAFEYILSPRQMYENKGIEQMNVISELIARIYQTEAKSLDPVVMTETSTSNFFDISGWMSKIKVIIFTIIGVIVTASTIAVTLKILPLKKLRSLRKKTQEIPINEIESVELLPRTVQPQPSIQGPRDNTETTLQMERVNSGIHHEHKQTVYVRGIGLLWQGCLCLAVPVFPENTNQGN